MSGIRRQERYLTEYACGCNAVAYPDDTVGSEWCTVHSAAPDLLAALERAVFMNAAPRAWMEQARVAIAKAREGET